MPLLPSLDDILRPQLRRAGLVAPRRQQRPSDLPLPQADLPLATRGLPQPSREEFEAGETERRSEPPSPGIPLIGQVLPTAQRLINILGSGEYAISNTLVDLIETSRTGEQFNPLDSFWRGLKSAVVGDERSRKTFYDVLTSAGWKDGEGFSENWGKLATSLVAGVLFDPISYVWFGAKGLNIAGRKVTEIANEASLWTRTKGLAYKLPEAVARKGLNLTKKGKDWFGRFTKGSLSPGLDAMGQIREGFEIERRFGRALLPVDGFTPAEALQIKGPDLIRKLLRSTTGKTPTVKEMEAFASRGYKELLDPGGLRVLGSRWFAPRGAYYGKFTAEAHGSLLGLLLKHGTPVHHAVARATIESKAWKALTWQPGRDAIRDFFAKHFSRLGRLSAAERTAVKALDAARDRSRVPTSAMVEGLMTEAAEGVEKELNVLGTSFRVPDPAKALRKVTPREEDLVGIMAIRARREGADIHTISSWLRNPDQKAMGWLRDLKLAGKSGLNDERIDFLSRVVDRVQRFMGDLGEAEKGWGADIPWLDQYIPRIYKKLNPEKRASRAFNATDDFWRKTQTVDWDYDDLLNRWRDDPTTVPGILETNIRKILEARIGSSLAQAHFRDAFAKLIPAVTTMPIPSAAAGGLLGRTPWVAKHPEAAEAYALGASHQFAPGMAAKDVKRFREIIVDLKKTTRNLEMADKNVDELIEAAGKLQNLSRENVKDLLRRYDEVLEPRAEWRKGAEQEAVLERLAARRKDLAKALIDRQTTQTFQTMAKDLRKATAETVPDLGVMVRKEHQDALARAAGGAPVSLAGMNEPQTTNAIRSMISRLEPQMTDPAMVRRVDRRAELAARTTGQLSEAANGLRQVFQRWTKRTSGQEIRGVPSDTVAAAEMARRFDLHLERVKTDSLETINRIIETPEAQRTAEQLAEWQLAASEYLTVQKLRAETPSAGFFGTVAEKAADYRSMIKDLREITALAKEHGVSAELNALIRHFSPGDTPAFYKLMPGQREALRKMIQGRDAGSRELARRLTPQFEWTYATRGKLQLKIKDVKPALTQRSVVIPSPITGKAIDANRIVGGDKWLAWAIEGAAKPFDPSKFGKLFQVFESGTAWLRKCLTAQWAPFVPLMRVAFHVRNSADLTFRTLLGYGIGPFLRNPDYFRDAVKMLKGAKEMIPDMGMRADDALDLLRSTNLIQTRFRKLDTAAAGRATELVTEAAGKWFPASMEAVKKASRWIQDKSALSWLGPQRAGVAMENFFSALAFRVGIGAGLPVHRVIDDMGQFLFYYANLTQGFEVPVMRNVFPFWAFQRQALGLVKWTAINNPRLWGDFRRVKDAAAPTKDIEAKIPEWIRQYPFVKWGGSGNKLQLLSMRNVFTVDVVNELLPSNWTEIVGQANPLLTTLPELALGRELYFKRDIANRRYLTGELQDPTWRKLWSWLDPKEVTLPDQEGRKRPFVAVTGWKYHALRRLWFSRFYRETDDMIDSLQGRMPPETLAGLLTGFKVREIDLEREAMFLQQDAEAARREYRHALKIGDSVRARQILNEMRLR